MIIAGSCDCKLSNGDTIVMLRQHERPAKVASVWKMKLHELEYGNHESITLGSDQFERGGEG